MAQTNNNIVSTALGDKETKNTVSNQISIDIEYPIQNGRVHLRGFLAKQTYRDLSDSSFRTSKDNGVRLSTLYNLDKSNSIGLSYYNVNTERKHSAPDRPDWNTDIKRTNFHIEAIHKF